MIRLLENPAIDIQYKLRTYYYVPVKGGPVSYREHQVPRSPARSAFLPSRYCATAPCPPSWR